MRGFRWGGLPLAEGASKNGQKVKVPRIHEGLRSERSDR